MCETLGGITAMRQACEIAHFYGSDFNSERFRELNKTLVLNAVMFYKECWKSRNECNNNVEQQKNRVIKWYEEVKQNIEENEPIAVKTFARRNAINVQRCNVDTIKQWIYNVKEIIKKVQRTLQGDIRRFIPFA